MIQSALFFVLGFLGAGLLALLLAPAIWRRAVVLTRRQVEASLPLTLHEIQAHKDGLRAEHAMAVRKLEMTIKALKEKAVAHMIEAGGLRDELVHVRRRMVELESELAGLAEATAEFEANHEAREAEKRRLTEERDALDKLAHERAAEIEKLGRMYDDASFTASSRQIEMVALEAKQEELTSQIAVLRNERKDVDARVRDADVETKSLRENLRAEKRKVAMLEKKQAGLIAAKSQFEEKLERRERDMERLREKLNRAEAAIVAPEVEIAAEHARLSDRIDSLMRENRKLREALTQQRRTEGARADAAGDALLRRQISELAAEVVHLTSKLDENSSSLDELLGNAAPNAEAGISLAERIRALQEADAVR